MTELKPYWNEAYSYLLSQLESQKRIKDNPHLIRGMVKGVFQKFFKANYEKNDDIRLSGIVQGDINGKRTYLSKIMQGKLMFGVLLNRQDEKCPACTLDSFCDRSYAASLLLLSPETLFVGYQKPNPELMGCHDEAFVAKMMEWETGGRTTARLKLSKTIEKDKLAEGLELADMVYNAFQYFQKCNTITEEIERLRNEFYKKLFDENLESIMADLKKGDKLGTN